MRILAALLLTLVSIVAARPAAADCPLSPGFWGGGFFMQVETSNQIQTTMNLGTATRTTALMDFEVLDDCSITGTFAEALNQVAVVMTGDVPFQGICNIPLRYTLIKGLAKSDGGLPYLALEVGVKFDSEQAKCYGDMADMAEPMVEEARKYANSVPERRTYRLFVTYDDGYEVSGDRSLQDPAVIRQVNDLRDNNIPYAETYKWILYRGGIPQLPPPPPKEEVEKGEPPEISEVRARLGEYFLEGIHLVVNDYSATVDWLDGTPGSVTFSIDSDTTYGQGGPSDYTAPMQISQLAAGGHLLTVLATNAKGAQRDRIKAIRILLLPEWAKPYAMMASDQGDWVLYSGKGQVPQSPLQFGIQIPSFVPYLGGLWGLSPTIFNLELNATSAGGLSNGVLTASGKLGVAGKESEVTLREDSYARTRMTETALLFDDGLIKLEAAPFSFTKRLALLDVIPGANALYDLPVVGGALKQFQPALFEATIAATLGGELPLGVVNDRIDLTGGTVISGVTLTAAAGPSVGVVFLQLIGQATGSLSTQVFPSVAITDCSLLASFYVRYGAFGYGGTFPNPPREIALTSCSQFAALPAGARFAQGPLGIAVPLPLVPLIPVQSDAPAPPTLLPRPAGWLAEAAASEPMTPDDIGALTLVLNVNAAVAAPALAADGQGRLALAWIAEDPEEARPKAWQLRLRLFDGAQWGEPIALGIAGPNYAPAVAFDGAGRAVVAWVQGPADAPSTLDAALLDSMEITTAVVAADGSVATLLPITEDSRPDSNPQLASGRDGSVWLAWQSHAPGRLLIDQSAPGRLMTAQWNGDGWSAPGVASDDLTGGVSWDLAALDRERAVVAARVGAGIGLLLHDASGWSTRPLAEAPLDASIAAAYGPQDQPLIAWSALAGVSGADGTLLPATTGGIVSGFDGATDSIDVWARADGRLVGISSTDAGRSLLLQEAESMTLLTADAGAPFAGDPAAEVKIGPLGYGFLAAAPDDGWRMVWTAPPADAPQGAQGDIRLLRVAAP